MIQLRRLAALASILCLVGMPALAQEPDTPAELEQLTKAEMKEQAREQRIQEYLRKKEEKRAVRQLESEAMAAQQQLEQHMNAQGTLGPLPPLPLGLAKAQLNVRESGLGQDPTVRQYLDLIDQQNASPQQLAAFGNFVASAGMSRDALEYYAVALNLEPDDALLWLNIGTLHRQIGDTRNAADAYSEALRITPNSAVVHYNLGAVFDDMGKYKEAIREYKLALTLDPSLGDPAVNPQAANNRNLLAVKLMLYREQTGALGLPLVDVPGGDLPSPGSTLNE